MYWVTKFLSSNTTASEQGVRQGQTSRTEGHDNGALVVEHTSKGNWEGSDNDHASNSLDSQNL